MLIHSSTLLPSTVRIRSRGFTLLEMLVATSVLALTLVLFAQITGSTVNTTQIGQHQLDVAGQARTAMDRFAVQFGGVMRAPGISLAVYKTAGNDGIAFVSNARAASSASSAAGAPRCSVVGFQVGTDIDPRTNGPILKWGSTAILWPAGPGAAGDDIFGKLDQAGGSQNTQPLAPNIFRLEFSFLLDTGSIVPANPAAVQLVANPSAAIDINAPGSGSAVYPALSKNANPNGAYVRAIIVGMAGISNDIRQIALNMNGVIAAFPDTVDNKTPLQAWDQAVVIPKLRKQSPPVPLLNNYRVYQRYFYVN